MSSELISRESRRSTRVPLRVLIEVQDGVESLTGETVIVNLHGALISTSIELNAGTAISVYVYLTDKRARAQVVHVDPENRMRCGIELEKPQNIWGVPLQPKDWEEDPY
jgi:PilZ domain